MDFKKICAIMICMILINTGCSTAVYAQSSNAFDVNGKSALLMEQNTGKVLYEKNSHEKLSPASVTKVMTLLLIFEAIEEGKISLDDIVSTSEHAASMGGSQVFLEPFEKQTVNTLIKCIAIASANDAAVTMAEYISGSEELFVEKMNQRAKELGMNDTTFKNACGLDDDGHLTSAYDIAIMSRQLVSKYPQVLEYTKVWQDTIVHSTARGNSEFGLTNTNKLLKWYSNTTGLKTGSTGKALYCMSATAEKDNVKLISVIMAAPDYKTRFLEAAKLLDYGFANYSVIKGRESGEVVGEVNIYKGSKAKITAEIATTADILVPKAIKEVESEIKLEEIVEAPVKKGDKLGEIIYHYNEEEVGRADLVATEDVHRAGFMDMFSKILQK